MLSQGWQAKVFRSACDMCNGAFAEQSGKGLFVPFICSRFRSHYILQPGIETWWSCSGLMEFCHSLSGIGCFPSGKFKHWRRDLRLNRWNRLNFCHISAFWRYHVQSVIAYRCHASALWFAYFSKFGQVNPKESRFLEFKGPICLQSRCLRHAQLVGVPWVLTSSINCCHSPYHSLIIFWSVCHALNSGPVPIPQVVNTLKRALIICISIQAGSWGWTSDISGVGLVQISARLYDTLCAWRYVVTATCPLWRLWQSGQFADAVGLISQLLVASNLPKFAPAFSGPLVTLW